MWGDKTSNSNFLIRSFDNFEASISSRVCWYFEVLGLKLKFETTLSLFAFVNALYCGFP